MSVLAFKAIDYGAEQIPDKFFEKIPGGFFTPAEKKHRKDVRDKKDRDKKDRERHQSEQRSSRRDRSDYSDYSAYDDTDYEHERDRRKQERRRRAKSAGRASSRSPSRGRRARDSSDLDGQYSDTRDMAHAEQGGPYFPPPPSSEYRPYNPQDYAGGSPQGDYRASSPGQPYGYPPQVNNFSPPHSATFPTMATRSTPLPAPAMSCPPVSTRRPSSALPFPFWPHPASFPFLHRGTPVSASFSPSTEPPLAALFSRPLTNTPQPAAVPPHSSASAARYTPGPGYAPSPAVNANIPAQPAAPNSPYAPYNPSDYTSNAGGYQAPGNAYPSPPPFSRQRSNSQPANPPYPTYVPPSAEQRMTAYDSSRPSSRRDSTKPRREHRHRARSADTRSSHKDYDPDHRRDSSRMTKMRERFDEGFLREPSGLAAAVGGALAGGFAGNRLGKSKLTTLAGAAAGALGGRAIADKRSK